MSGLTGMLVGVHATLAMLTQTPELAISDDEGAGFMKAAQNVMQHYSVTSTQKSIDWITFFGATLGMYAPRIVAIRMRQAEERRMRAAQGVHHFPAAEARRRGPRPVEPASSGSEIMPDPMFTGEDPNAA